MPRCCLECAGIFFGPAGYGGDSRCHPINDRFGTPSIENPRVSVLRHLPRALVAGLPPVGPVLKFCRITWIILTFVRDSVWTPDCCGKCELDSTINAGGLPIHQISPLFLGLSWGYARWHSSKSRSHSMRTGTAPGDGLAGPPVPGYVGLPASGSRGLKHGGTSSIHITCRSALLFAGLGVSTTVALLGGLWRFAQGPRRGACRDTGGSGDASRGVLGVRGRHRPAEPSTPMGTEHVCHASVRGDGRQFLRGRGSPISTSTGVEEACHVLRPPESRTSGAGRSSRERPGGHGRASRPPRANAGRDDLVEGVLDPRAGSGLEGLGFHGLSLGSAWSPEVGGPYRVDAHELAHAALDWFRVPGSDPPCLLHEGWAMSQCGDGWLELARAAGGSRREIPRSGSGSYWGRTGITATPARLLGGRCFRRFPDPDPRRRTIPPILRRVPAGYVRGKVPGNLRDGSRPPGGRVLGRRAKRDWADCRLTRRSRRRERVARHGRQPRATPSQLIEPVIALHSLDRIDPIHGDNRHSTAA